MSLLAGPLTNVPKHVPSFQQDMFNAFALVACKLIGHKISAVSLFSHHMRHYWQSYLYNYIVYTYRWRINSEKFEGYLKTVLPLAAHGGGNTRRVFRLSKSASADYCSRVGLFIFMLIRISQLTKGLWWEFVIFVAFGMLVRAAICLFQMILFAGGPSQWLLLSSEEGSRKHAHAIL